jgi:transcriptional regulator with XRE-family HTH domain
MTIASAIGNFNSPLISARYVVSMAGTRADRLQEAMDQAGLDQPALASRVGCTQGAISQILLGNTQRSKLLPDIARELGVSVDWLTGDSNTRDPSAPSMKAVADHFDLAMVKELELGYSMGGGSIFESYEQKGVVPFQRAWLRSMMRGSFDDLFVARGEGDSMQPTLLDGDIVLIDTSQKDIRQQDRIWAVAYGELGMIKRVRRQPGGSYLVMSDNAAVAPFTAVDEEMHVIGRVIWIGRRM